MTPLPIDAVLAEVLAAARGGTFVLVAPPGAGKTTRVPPALLDVVQGEVVVLEPRRVAARAAARRMAEERGEPLGRTVGYQVRFDRVDSPATRIRVVTEGVLLRRLQDDPLLQGVGAVLVDELHERSLDADLSLALLAEVREARPELVVGAMSATMDPGPIAAFLGAPVVESAGRAFPVEVSYLPYPDERPVEDVVADGVRRALAEGDGDVLAFLPGVREIRRTAERLPGIDVVPLYGDLPPEAQDAALRPGSGRRVVLATNVAETSVTVPGVATVVDGGLVRRPSYDPGTGLDRLDTVRVSRASADQRAGRAGRTGPGRALRLWTERLHLALSASDPAEVRRVDLAGPVLQLLAWGSDPLGFRWLEAPPEEAIRAALRLLADLGAVEGRHPTPLGRALVALPLHPRLGRLVLEGARLGHPDDAALAAAILAERDMAGPGAPSASDVLDRVDAVREGRGDPGLRRHVLRAADQIRRRAPRPGDAHPFPVAPSFVHPSPIPPPASEGPRSARPSDGSRRSASAEDADGATLTRDEALLRAVLAAWPDRVARRRAPGSDRALMVGGKGVVLGGSAVREPELFVCVDLDAAGPEAKVRAASAVDRGWLSTEATEELAFDDAAGRVTARVVVRYRDLELAAHPTAPDPERAAALLADAAAARIDRAMPDDDGWRQLLARIACLAEWRPDHGAFDPRDLLPALCAGRRSLDDLRRADWTQAVREALGSARWRALEELAPERIAVPSGSRVRLAYEVGRPPVLAVRVQELFGLARTPTVAGGRVRVLLHLLAPNGRPQQVTDDLAGFWERTWPEVRKELRARYPRHAWPEDPLAARPESRPRRRT